MKAFAPAATEKQQAFIVKLTTEKDWTSSTVAARIQQLLSGETITRQQASSLIDELIKMKNNGAANPKQADVEDGFYVLDGVIWKVQKSLSSNRKYAKKLVDGEFRFTPGAVAKLAKAEKLTLEKAKEFGKLYGMCVICGRTLTDETSIAAGIGPICAEKF
jgi:hypothetical protein